MRIWKRVCAFALAALLVLPAAASAQSYTDLSTSHWAYDDMQRADGAVLLMRCWLWWTRNTTVRRRL